MEDGQSMLSSYWGAWGQSEREREREREKTYMDKKKGVALCHLRQVFSLFFTARSFPYSPIYIFYSLTWWCLGIESSSSIGSKLLVSVGLVNSGV